MLAIALYGFEVSPGASLELEDGLSFIFNPARQAFASRVSMQDKHPRPAVTIASGETVSFGPFLFDREGPLLLQNGTSVWRRGPSPSSGAC